MISLDVDSQMDILPRLMEVMVPIVAIVGGLGLAFANRYLKSKERMEMISRGMDVSAIREADMADAIAHASRRRRNPIRNGLVLLGVGVGLLISYALCHTVLRGNDDENSAIYFGIIAVFVGLALIVSHMMDKKPLTDSNS